MTSHTTENEMKYEPGQFKSTFKDHNGQAIWECITSADNLIRMETATYLSRPAAEPLSPQLLHTFGEAVKADRVKQMVGHMIRQIMEARGYRLDQSSVRINRAGNIFSSAARYAAANKQRMKK